MLALTWNCYLRSDALPMHCMGSSRRRFTMAFQPFAWGSTRYPSGDHDSHHFHCSNRPFNSPPLPILLSQGNSIRKATHTPKTLQGEPLNLEGSLSVTPHQFLPDSLPPTHLPTKLTNATAHPQPLAHRETADTRRLGAKVAHPPKESLSDETNQCKTKKQHHTKKKRLQLNSRHPTNIQPTETC